MLKQLIALVCLSILIVLSMSYAQQGVQWLIAGHDWISQILTDVFSGGNTGNAIRGLIALISIPIIVGAVPTILYWIVKRGFYPYFMQTVWAIWLIQTGALVMMYNATAVS